MSIEQAYNIVEDVLRAGNDPVSGLSCLMQLCREVDVAGTWSDIPACTVEADQAAISESVLRLFSTEPPKPDIRAFWFGLFDRVEEAGTYCQMYVSGSTVYTEDTLDWACWGPDSYLPEGRYLDSAVLRHISRMATEQEAESDTSGVSYVLSLGYAALTVRQLCRNVDVATAMLGEAQDRRMVVGFDDGDFLTIGTITAAGFISG